MGDEAKTPVVVALVKDLFFSVKLGNELRAAGYAPGFAKTVEAFGVLLAERRPALGIIDLTAVSDWGAIERLGQDQATAGTPLLVFGPHKDVEGLRAAKAAGVARVVSNRQFHADVAGLVARYARA